MLSEIICFSVSEQLKDKNVVISEIQIRTISPSMKDGLTFSVNLKPENKQTNKSKKPNKNTITNKREFLVFHETAPVWRTLIPELLLMMILWR